MKKLIAEVKRKKEFNQLPGSVVIRALENSQGDVKEARALLRKYFGVFLTNKILKEKHEGILKKHISTKNRNYDELYGQIFESEEIKGAELEKISSIVDLGCGVNGFSYRFLKEVVGEVDYTGVEAVGQLVDNINEFFEKEKFSKAGVVWGDLFDIDFVLKILKKQKKSRVVFLFQVIDAFEKFEKGFTKKFLLEIMKECELFVLSFPTWSLSGKSKFKVSRDWLWRFVEEEFELLKQFSIHGEKFLIIKNKN
tara:strand:+ start:648 stop:1406 length:759 start_codon:yes stop_codon:yes gene_type:complete